MIARVNILLIASVYLCACVATPRVELPNQFSFNYQIPNQAPMSYNDILCCYDCQV